MAGVVKRVLERTLYNIKGTQMPTTATQVFVVAQNVDVSQFVFGHTLLRVHSFQQTGGTQATTQAKVQIDVFRSAPTEEDPALTFRDAVAISNLTVSYTFAGPPLLNPNAAILVSSPTLANLMGETVDVVVTITPSNPSVDLNISISVDLVLKS